MLNYQEYFETFLRLVGSEVEIGVRVPSSKSAGRTISGRVENSMFDSLIISSAGKNSIVRFEDILFVNSAPQVSSKQSSSQRSA